MLINKFLHTVGESGRVELRYRGLDATDDEALMGWMFDLVKENMQVIDADRSFKHRLIFIPFGRFCTATHGMTKKR